ncbi:hypothetical protein BIV24_17995 [Streptomyces colonosanans]|uniref:Uncharacterized protein n=1 Tax=Streptomyces colonosanans TaxID=1428652 RepID=A0A1S2P9S7_9ACTN|nr:hypothetical protein BIV24_17995 [Streptomyces colonosanans]
MDGAQGTGDVEQPVRLRTADAELRVAVRLPRAVAEREPHPGAVRVTDPGGENGDHAPDIVHDLPQSIRHRAGVRGGRWPRHRFGDIVLVLIALAHLSIVRRPGGPHQGARKHRARPLTGSQLVTEHVIQRVEHGAGSAYSGTRSVSPQAWDHSGPCLSLLLLPQQVRKQSALQGHARGPGVLRCGARLDAMVAHRVV